MEIILIVILIILFIGTINVYKLNKLLEYIKEDQKDVVVDVRTLVDLYSQIIIDTGIAKDKSVETCNKIDEIKNKIDKIKDNNFDKKDLYTKFESLHARLDHNDDVNDAIIHKIIRLGKDKNKVKQEKK